jgi:WhiB family redox-sensing transcriptional regulator
VNDHRNLTRRAPGGPHRATSPRRGAPIDPIGRRAPLSLPCQVHDRDLWFADEPAQLERAKQLCTSCPVLHGCLAGAVQREEAAGVWGGQIFDRGRIVTHKRPRGRPRKNSTAPQRRPASSVIATLEAAQPARGRHREVTPGHRATPGSTQASVAQGA